MAVWWGGAVYAREWTPHNTTPVASMQNAHVHGTARQKLCKEILPPPPAVAGGVRWVGTNFHVWGTLKKKTTPTSIFTL